MITVVIAEDEALEMRSLEEDIDYTSLGMQLIGKAYNGSSALELVETLQPDILITDIVMPKLSGLELTKRAKQLCPNIRIILVSGHQRFDYATTAIDYGVEAYLIKPLFPETLYQVLSNIAVRIRENNRRLASEKFYSEAIQTQLPLLRELFVSSLMEGKHPSDIQKRFDYYGITLADAPLYALCLLPEEKNDITMFTLRNCVSAFFQTNGRNYCFATLTRIQNEPLCVLFQHTDGDDQSSIFTLAEQLRIAIFTDGGFNTTIGIGSLSSGWDGAPVSVSHARRALEYRFYLGSGQVIAFQDITSGEYTNSPQNLRRLFVPLLDAADKGDSAELDRLCDELYQESASFSPELLRILFSELISRILSSHYEAGVDTSNLTRYLDILTFETLDELINQLKKELLNKKENLDNYITGREHWLVKKITEEIDIHYAENLTIEEIAKRVYISSGYAIRLFRKHTGETINSYIIRTRMAAAAEILKNPSVSINEAAAQTGYTNVAYFSSTFRKYYNHTPREWRDMHAGKNIV